MFTSPHFTLLHSDYHLHLVRSRPQSLRRLGRYESGRISRGRTRRVGGHAGGRDARQGVAIPGWGAAPSGAGLYTRRGSGRIDERPTKRVAGQSGTHLPDKNLEKQARDQGGNLRDNLPGALPEEALQNLRNELRLGLFSRSPGDERGIWARDEPSGFREDLPGEPGGGQ